MIGLSRPAEASASNYSARFTIRGQPDEHRLATIFSSLHNGPESGQSPANANWVQLLALKGFENYPDPTGQWDVFSA